jgi:hydroxycarboxylate dehydrogenase B
MHALILLAELGSHVSLSQDRLQTRNNLMAETLHDAESLTALAYGIIKAAGWTDADAAELARHLVLANLSGHDSHGMGMLPVYVTAISEGLLSPDAKPRTRIEAAPFLVIEADVALGQPVAANATRRACAMAKGGGIAVLNLLNAHHMGRIGHYAEMAAAEGLVSMFWVNVAGRPPIVAPHGAREARFGTNPHTIGVPNGDTPLILDFATSRMAHGKARVAHNKGERAQPGYLIDHEGQPTTDPSVVLEPPLGALLPFGDHKGAGIALMAEILSAGLSGGPTMPTTPHRARIINSLFGIFIDPARLDPDQDGQTGRSAALADFVRSAVPRDGVEAVLAPGDKERATRIVRARDGIPVDDETWRLLMEAGARFGVGVR